MTAPHAALDVSTSHGPTAAPADAQMLRRCRAAGLTMAFAAAICATAALAILLTAGLPFGFDAPGRQLQPWYARHRAVMVAAATAYSLGAVALIALGQSLSTWHRIVGVTTTWRANWAGTGITVIAVHWILNAACLFTIAIGRNSSTAGAELLRFAFVLCVANGAVIASTALLAVPPHRSAMLTSYTVVLVFVEIALLVTTALTYGATRFSIPLAVLGTGVFCLWAAWAGLLIARDSHRCLHA
ncbi:hypothetical protein AB0A77_36395 [Streptomyces varsoviensis]|uniref:hypothetical protein n=1 Tax=Streptomyces varsoviensis TaxID=67373 RepID=UPI0033C4D31F